MKSFWRKASGKALLFCGCLVFAGLFALSLFLTLGMVESGFYWRSVEDVFRLLVDDGMEEGLSQFIWDIVNIGYTLRYWMPVIAVLALVGCITSFVSLMVVAGKSPDTEEVSAEGLHKIPYELLLGAFFCCFPIAEEIIWSCQYQFDDFLVVFIGCCLFTTLACTGLWVCMTTAVRIKNRSFWKSTLCFWAFGVIRKIWNWAWSLMKRISAKAFIVLRSLPMLWRTGLVVLGISLVEFFVLCCCFWQGDLILLFWFLEKLIIIPVVMYGAYCLRQLQKGGIALAEGDLTYHTDTRGMFWDFKRHGENLNSIAVGMTHAVEERMKSEHMKTELITNVSHDIKTPLTSIINYARLIGNEPCENEKITQYAQVLVRQSDRLKRLIEDLVEASKASTGSLDVFLAPCDASVFLTQAVGEYEDRLEKKDLTLVVRQPEKEVRILADGRRMWRIFDNLMNNICKYAQPGTRVYLTLEEQGKNALISFKNISAEPLDLSEEALMERFVRGDQSRNTEGNGLGLSIAKSLAELQNGSLSLSVDGDLFKAVLTFPEIES